MSTLISTSWAPSSIPPWCGAAFPFSPGLTKLMLLTLDGRLFLSLEHPLAPAEPGRASIGSVPVLEQSYMMTIHFLGCLVFHIMDSLDSLLVPICGGLLEWVTGRKQILEETGFDMVQGVRYRSMSVFYPMFPLLSMLLEDPPPYS